MGDGSKECRSPLPETRVQRAHGVPPRGSRMALTDRSSRDVQVSCVYHNLYVYSSLQIL